MAHFLKKDFRKSEYFKKYQEPASYSETIELIVQWSLWIEK